MCEDAMAGRNLEIGDTRAIRGGGAAFISPLSTVTARNFGGQSSQGSDLRLGC
jgi:hypothetical protein